MIGLDTNILLRLWLNDDPAQNKRIDKLLAEHGSAPGSLLLSDVVLAEDLTGKGHITRTIGNEDRVTVSIPVTDR